MLLYLFPMTSFRFNHFLCDLHILSIYSSRFIEFLRWLCHRIIAFSHYVHLPANIDTVQFRFTKQPRPQNSSWHIAHSFLPVPTLNLPALLHTNPQKELANNDKRNYFNLISNLRIWTLSYFFLKYKPTKYFLLFSLSLSLSFSFFFLFFFVCLFFSLLICVKYQNFVCN